MNETTMKTTAGHPPKDDRPITTKTATGYHKLQISSTSSYLLPLPGPNADAPIERYLNVVYDYETRQRYGYVVTGSEVAQ
jgi:hypothetical protein